MKTNIPGVVSVILVNFRGTDDTIECIEGLRKLNWPEHLLEIIVVENGSGDDSLARLRAIPLRLRVIESMKNLGFTGGCNLAASQASGEFIALLNNDARPHADWIKAGIDTFATGQDIAAVASKVLDWDGAKVDFTDAAITWYGMGYKPHAGESDNPKWSVEKDVLFGTGAAMFIRSAVFEELGGFDDNFFMFYDDVDLGWRLNLLGYRFRFQPKSLVYHKHHASMTKFGDFREEYLLERNALFTLYKNLDDTSLEEIFPGSLLLAIRRSVARGKLDSTIFDLRIPGDDSDPTMSVPKSTMAGVLAIDQFVEKLPEMSALRAKIQSTRRVSDRQLKLLFGNVDEPAFSMDTYLGGYEKIANALGIMTVSERRRVLIVTGDPIGQQMAGPAIRAWNIALLLSKEHDVRLVSTNRALAIGQPFEVSEISLADPKSAGPHEEWADIIIVQGHALQRFPALESTKKVLVVDVYDPLHLEQLEQGKELPFKVWNEHIANSTEALNHQLLLGDFFLCASERQRNFWLGQLAALGRINAFTYSRDSELNSLIAIAPFGIPAEEPRKTHPAIRGIVPGIGETDKVIIWGGGIYAWFDPETLIRAVAQVAKNHPDIRLFFLGVRHPNPDVPEMETVARSRLLATQLGVYNKYVFFNETWVAYEDRHNFLLEADVGVSTHYQHVETTFSFRTRILDYLWASLPIVSTAGDSFGDLVATEKLGVTVPERDQQALEDALTLLLYDEEAAAEAKLNVEKVRLEFTWEQALEPLVQFCRNPISAADRPNHSSKRVRTGTRLASKTGSNRSPNTGVRRDIDRVVYYLQNGGVAAVLDRFHARQERLKASKE